MTISGTSIGMTTVALARMAMINRQQQEGQQAEASKLLDEWHAAINACTDPRMKWNLANKAEFWKKAKTKPKLCMDTSTSAGIPLFKQSGSLLNVIATDSTI